jgi:hypothetical protein
MVAAASEQAFMSHTAHQPVIVSINTPTLTRYIEACEDTHDKLGLSPGPEYLMSLAIEHEDPFEFSNLYIAEIVAALREEHA